MTDKYQGEVVPLPSGRNVRLRSLDVPTLLSAVPEALRPAVSQLIEGTTPLPTRDEHYEACDAFLTAAILEPPTVMEWGDETDRAVWVGRFLPCDKKLVLGMVREAAAS